MTGLWMQWLIFAAWNVLCGHGFFVGQPAIVSRGRFSFESSSVPIGEETSLQESSNEPTKIRSIRSHNLAGMVGTIVVEEFDDSSSLIAITGETGTGKSLLFAKTMDLLTGSKAPPSLLVEDAETSTFCELSLNLSEPHLAIYQRVLRNMGVDTATLTSTKVLTFRRTLFPGSIPGRVKSECHVNGHKITLKRLAHLVAPLVTVVDAPAAATALSNASARLALIDASVCLESMRTTGERYRTCRSTRERLEAELASLNFDPVQDEELLDHWIDELDAFSIRVTKFCRHCVDQEGGSGDDNALRTVEWSSNQIPNGRTFVSAMYETLKELQGNLRSLDNKIVSIQGAVDALSMLSVPNSAVSALENARRLISNTNGDMAYEESQERSHELLNQIETALLDCARFVEDDPTGLLQLAEQEKAKYLVSADAVDEILADWGTLARKHGVLPTSLPIRHSALKHEKDGSKGVAERLPIAVEAEKEALASFETVCSEVRQARTEVANRIMADVNERLPSLGMESSSLRITVSKVRSCRDQAAFGSSPILGCDTVELTLEKNDATSERRGATRRSKVGDSASSGEKARLLLALECASPGAISAMTKSASSLDVDFDIEPAITVYDEIDAHVGGRAAVAVAHMLAEQVGKSQILAITHSPSVAAIADSHLVVRKTEGPEHTAKVSVCKVVGDTRRLELARMTSGDVAPDEAIAFADALMRDISKKQETTSAA